jgi:hypothetical protein
MSFLKLLNKTCDIYEKTQDQDLLGQMVESWSLKTADVKCRCNFDRNSGNDSKLGFVSILGCRFYFDIGVELNEGNRVLFENEYYEIDTVVATSNDHHLEVQAHVIFTQ